MQIVEIYQHTMAAHVHSKTDTGIWGLFPVSGTMATIDMPSIGIAIPLIDLYENAMPAEAEENADHGVTPPRYRLDRQQSKAVFSTVPDALGTWPVHEETA